MTYRSEYERGRKFGHFQGFYEGVRVAILVVVIIALVYLWRS